MADDERTTSLIDKIVSTISDATMNAWGEALGEHLVRGDTGNVVFESGDFPPHADYAFDAAIRTATEEWMYWNRREEDDEDEEEAN